MFEYQIVGFNYILLTLARRCCWYSTSITRQNIKCQWSVNRTSSNSNIEPFWFSNPLYIRSIEFALILNLTMSILISKTIPAKCASRSRRMASQNRAIEYRIILYRVGISKSNFEIEDRVKHFTVWGTAQIVATRCILIACRIITYWRWLAAAAARFKIFDEYHPSSELDAPCIILRNR